MAAAIHTLDTILQGPNSQRSVEATAMLASLRANPRPGVSTSEVAKEKASARQLFEDVIKTLKLPEDLQRSLTNSFNGSTPPRLSKSARNIAEDIEMHTEIAKLWQGENSELMSLAVKEALRINEATGGGTVDPRLMNNLGVLRQLDGQLPEARVLYETALLKTAASGFNEGELGEGVLTTILYNLARVYEDQGEVEMANDAYEKLLARHPEYVDGTFTVSLSIIYLMILQPRYDRLIRLLVSIGAMTLTSFSNRHFRLNKTTSMYAQFIPASSSSRIYQKQPKISYSLR
jgi:RNA polymerase-associated protein CTR9